MSDDVILEDDVDLKEEKSSVPAEEEPSKDLKDIKGPFYRVKVIHSCETEVCVLPEGVEVKTGDIVILNSKYGKDIGEIRGEMHCVDCINKSLIKDLDRVASEKDIALYEDYKIKEKEAIVLCREKVHKHKLDMKLVSCHYLPEESKILFFFTAEARVDFRELVKDLVSIFRMRIELRQIGVRDESRVVGGLGVCGRTYCCHGLTDNLRPVSIKMAKEQNLSLNSMKISGPCGRLLCCLSYEYDIYHEIKKNLPHHGAFLKAGKDVYRVEDVNILSRKIMLSTDRGKRSECSFDDLKYNEEKRQWTAEIPEES